MKIYIYTLFCGILFMLSCNNSLKSEGNIQDKIINLKEFDEVKLSGRFRTIFIQDKVSKIRIESYKNIIDNINVNQNGFGISVEENKNVSDEVEVYNVYIYSPKINEIKAENNVLIDAPSLIRNNKIYLELKDNVKFISEIHADDLKINISDNVDLNIKGASINLELNQEDNSVIKAPFLLVNNAEVKIFDNSQAEININEKLSGKLKDNSKLVYLGNPTKNIEQKDLSSIEQR